MNNVADTGRNIVSYARSQGRNWRLRQLPAGVGSVPSIVTRRATDALKWTLLTPTPDLLHIHYAPNGYYGWLKRAPYVLHLHGTDLRQDLHRPLIGDLTRQAIKRAAAVIAATPDLLEPLLELRDDAIHVPNALPLELLDHKTLPAPSDNRVVFNARWDQAKGGESLVAAAKTLVEAGVDVVGIDWGPLSTAAAEVGVHLLPLQDKRGYHALLESATVVVGQFALGILSISDFEAMALGRPLVTGATTERAPIAAADRTSIADQVLALLADPVAAKRLGAAGRQWVLDTHHPAITLGHLEELYRRILK